MKVVPAYGRVVGMTFKVPSNPNYSVTPRFYVARWVFGKITSSTQLYMFKYQLMKTETIMKLTDRLLSSSCF